MILGLLAFAVLGGAPPIANLSLPGEARVAGYTYDYPFPELPAVPETGLVLAPGDTNRLFVLAKAGVIYVITNLAKPTWSVFLDLSARTYDVSESGLLGLAFHPGFRTNGEVFVFYSTTTTTDAGSGLHQRISRFLIDPTNPDQALAASETPLITQYDRDPTHNGGTLRFGPEGYLYASVGDEGGDYDSFGNSQRIDGGFFSAVLRLDVDKRPGNLPPNPHPAVNPGSYLVPADNPWVGAVSFLGDVVDPGQVRTEFYAIGFRNPFRFNFDPATGDLYVNDVGQASREEVNIVVAGGNYGWSFFEGSLPNPGRPAPDFPFLPPVFEYGHENYRMAVVGGVMCRGVSDPFLEGGYFFLDYGGDQALLRKDASGAYQATWLDSQLLVTSMTEPVIHPQTGDILCANFLGGGIWRFHFADNGAVAAPPLLSATGLFVDTPGLKPAPGVTPYEVNAPFWSDGASKQRWFCLTATNQAFGWRGAGSWDSQPGAVWVKQFDLQVATNGGAGLKHIETRVLRRTTNGIYGLSYRWNDAQTDAQLVDATGADVAFPVPAPGGAAGTVSQTWHFPSQTDCQACHNPTAGYVLGFCTSQLNRDVLRDGVTNNQIDWLRSQGFLSSGPSVPTAFLPRLAAIGDATAGHRWQARSFLAANCSVCHSPGGASGANWDARAETPLSEAGIVDAPALINLSDIWLSVPTFIAWPGSPETSAIYRRVADVAAYHMPPIATSVINQAAVSLLADWINIDLPARPTYAQWVAATFPTNAPSSQTAPTADPNGDGISNQVEWLLGSSPPSSTRPWRLQAIPQADGLHISYLRKADLGFQIESASAVGPGAVWTTVVAPGNEFMILAEDQTAEVVLPLGSEAAFYRVNIFEP